MERDVGVTPTSTQTPATTDAAATNAPATVDALVAALADPNELPPGWQAKDGSPETTLRPRTIPAFGTCGDDNLDATALRHGVVAFAASPGIRTSDGGHIHQQLFAFPTSTEAVAFMATWRAAPTCRDGKEATLEEGDRPGQYDGFTSERPEFATAVWRTHESVSLVAVDPPEVDEAFSLKRRRDYQATVLAVVYGASETILLQYERLNSVVAVTSISGRCCLYGYADSDIQDSYTPADTDLLIAVGTLRPRLVSALTATKILPAEF
ncbi:MAG: hypothetical protein AB7V43_19830 [Acidimicrobiia bacterium]